MPLPTFYATGTASVANGSSTITFNGAILGTAENANIWPHDLFLDPAQPLVPPQRIASVDYEAGTATLAVNWPGTTMASDPYEVRYVGIVERSTAQTRRLLEQMSVVEANGRGLFYRFDDATTDADPGSGNLRLNNSAPGSATAAYLDNLDANGATVSAELDTWGEGTGPTKGRLWLRAVADPSAFHSYDITAAVVDGTGYRKLSLDYVGGSGSFADSDELMVAFAAIGDQGSGYEYDAEATDSSGLTPFETEDPGYKVWLDDLGTDFGAYAGRGGVVRLVAGPDWEVVAVYTGPQGIQGEQGEQGEQGIQGERGITWRGAYSALTAYVTDDGVLDNGSSWRALQATTGNAPPVLPTASNAYWTLVAAKGTDGTGTGDVVGPASAVANRLAAYDGTTGKLLKDSGLLLSEVATEAYVDAAVAGVDLSPVENSVDELRIALMMMQLLQADILNVPSWIGPSGNFFADSFETLSYVDVAGATNLDTGTAGALKPTLGSATAIPGATGTNIGDMTGGGGLAAIFDGTTNQSDAASGQTSSGSANTAYAGKNYSSSPKRIAKADIYPTNSSHWLSAADGTFNVTLTLYGKNGSPPANSTDGTPIGSVGPFSEDGTAPRTITSTDQSTSWDYVWVGLLSSGATGTRYMAELVLYEPASPANLTVESKDYVAASAPTQMQVVMFVREEVAAVAGTDYSLKLTRNDAAYGSAVTLNELYSLALADGSTVRVVRTNVEDVSGITSGTEPGWRFQTLTNKMAYLVGAVTYWS